MNTQQRLDASMELMERSNQEFNPGGNTMIAAELLWGPMPNYRWPWQNSKDGRHSATERTATPPSTCATYRVQNGGFRTGQPPKDCIPTSIKTT